MSSAIMNPAYYVEEPHYMGKPVGKRALPSSSTQTRRSSVESEYSLIKPVNDVKPKNKTFLGIFVKTEKPKTATKASSPAKKAKETTMYDIAHGSTAWK